MIHARNHMMGTKGQQHNHKQIKSIIAIHQPPIGQGKLSIPVSEDNEAQAQQNRVMNIVLSVRSTLPQPVVPST